WQPACPVSRGRGCRDGAPIHAGGTPSTALTLGQWHHVGLIFEGNSTDGSTDTHLYLNHQLIASGNMTDTINFGGAAPGFNFFMGGVNGPRQVRVDESRYFDTALALDGSQFLLPAGVPAPQLVVDRQTGAITLTNNAIGQGNFEILGYSITSEFGSLDQAGWKNIANNYDAGNPGAIDTEQWTVLTEAGSYTDLSEYVFDGDGASLSPGQSLVLSPGSGAWIGTPVEDLVVEFSLSDGSFLTLQATHVGNNDMALPRSDFDRSGTVTAAD